MKQEDEFKEGNVDLRKERNVDLFAFHKTSRVTIEEVQDPQPMFALSEHEESLSGMPILSLEDAAYDKDSEDGTAVDEPPPCPVDMLYPN